MKKTEEEKSPAYQLVRQVWRHSPRHGRSWIRFNQSLAGAVRLAIKAGLEFALKDFRDLFDNMRGGYWFGASEGRIAGEHFYRCAVQYDHPSACLAFEHFAKRPPFILDTGARAAIGTEVTWNGLRCVVTSFREGDIIGLAHYKEVYAPPPDLDVENLRPSVGVGKPSKLFSIELASWRAAMGARRKAKKVAKKQETARLEERLAAAATMDPATKTFIMSRPYPDDAEQKEAKKPTQRQHAATP